MATRLGGKALALNSATILGFVSLRHAPRRVQRGKYYVLSDEKNPRLQEYFDPFCPKILTQRGGFEDNALEGRLLSISPRETANPAIPVLLPPD